MAVFDRPVLVAPDAFSATLSAPAVAAAIGRGLERVGLPPPDLCPVSSGGPGTVDVLLPVLGGETAAGFALVEDGATALVQAAPSSCETGQRVAAAVDAGAAVVVLAAGGAHGGGMKALAVVEAIEQAGGLRGATLVVLCDERASWRDSDTAGLRRDPRGVAMTGAGGGLAGVLWAQCDARLVSGPGFVLEALDFDARMRAARAVVVAEPRLDRGSLLGRVLGEIATRARQSGVPCHAITAENAIERFDARILDLQAIGVAATVQEVEDAGAALAGAL